MLTKKNVFSILIFFTAIFFTVTTFAAASPKVSYDIYGKPHAISLKNNKWIIINYWADWCHYCVEEIPDLNELAEKVKNMPVIFFGINYDDISAQAQRKFARDYHVNFLLLRNNPFEYLISQRSFSTLPTTFVISPQGEVKRLGGKQTANSILAEIRS